MLLIASSCHPVHIVLVVSMLYCQPTYEGSRPQDRNLVQAFCSTCSSTSSKLGYNKSFCQWEDEMAREMSDHPLAYAKAKKMKSLTLHTHGNLFFFFVTIRIIVTTAR